MSRTHRKISSFNAFLSCCCCFSNIGKQPPLKPTGHLKQEVTESLANAKEKSVDLVATHDCVIPLLLLLLLPTYPGWLLFTDAKAAVGQTVVGLIPAAFISEKTASPLPL